MLGAEYALQFGERAELGPQQRNDLPNLIFDDLRDLSPEQAGQLAKEHFKGIPLMIAMNNIAQLAFAKDKLLGIKMGREIPDQSSRDVFFANRFTEWLRANPKEALLQLEKIEQKQLAGMIREDKGDFMDPEINLTNILAKLKPELLEKTLGTMAATSSNEPAFRQGVESLSREHPERALSLIETMPEGEMKVKLYGVHFDQQISLDFGAAMSTFSELPQGEVRSAAYQKVGSHLGGKKGFSETMAQLDGIPEADRASFLEGAIPYLASEDPRNVIGLLNGTSAPISGETRTTALASVGQQLTRNDPEAAQQWLGGLKGDDRAPALEAMSRVMVQSDVEGLVETLSAVPKDEGWAAGVRVLIDDLKSSDPQTSRTWAELLEKSGF